MTAPAHGCRFTYMASDFALRIPSRTERQAARKTRHSHIVRAAGLGTTGTPVVNWKEAIRGQQA